MKGHNGRQLVKIVETIDKGGEKVFALLRPKVKLNICTIGKGGKAAGIVTSDMIHYALTPDVI